MIIFEVASEAGRKIGGIYTVLSSKAKQMVKQFGDNYYLIGVYDAESLQEECVVDKAPADLLLIFERLATMGIKAYFCTWKGGGNAKLITLDVKEFGQKFIDGKIQTNIIKKWMWDKYEIDSLNSNQMFNDNVTWSYATGILIEELSKLDKFKNERIVAHFHEWISGTGLLYLKDRVKNVATTFTTHATSMGRSFAMVGLDVLEKMKESEIMDQHLAYNFKLEAQHQLERACAQNANCFTTVSEVVGEEAEWVFGVKPHIITENAIDISRFEDWEEIRSIKEQSRKEVDYLIRANFEPHYKLRDYLIVFLASRYEMKGKGIDIFLKALQKANKKLTNKQKQIIAFICTPTKVIEPRPELERNYDIFKDIAEISEEIFGKIISKKEAGSIKTDKESEKITAREIFKLYANMKTTSENVPSNAFILGYPHDEILSMAHNLGLKNTKKDNVKVIYYSTYVKPGDMLLNMEFDRFVSSTDVGCFPSRYEPWGYTPMEAASWRVISITTDMAGYGRYIEQKMKSSKNSGIKVLKIANRDFEKYTQELADFFVSLAGMSKEQLQKLSNDAFEKMKLSRWEDQVKKYFKAYEIALGDKK